MKHLRRPPQKSKGYFSFSEFQTDLKHSEEQSVLLMDIIDF